MRCIKHFKPEFGGQVTLTRPWKENGYTPFRGTKGTDREGGSRVPAIAWWPKRIKPGSETHDIVGGLDLLATYASIAGVELPKKDREGQPIVFDSYDMTPLLFGTGKCKRTEWYYFTETELSPGAVPYWSMEGRLQSARG